MGILGMLLGSLCPLEDVIHTHQGSAHNAIPAIKFPFFKPKSNHLYAKKNQKKYLRVFYAALKDWR